MPKSIEGKPLSEKEHEIWKAVFEKTASAAIATKAVKKYREDQKK